VPFEDPCDTRPQSAGGSTVVLDKATAEECKREQVPVDASFGTAQQRAIAGGNPELKPEKAHTYTAGIVLEPPQVPGLGLTADYWNIDVQDSIGFPQISTIFTKCYEQHVDSYCKLIDRNPNQSYAINLIHANQGNLGELETSGLDLSAVYHHGFPGLGSLHMSLDATYLLAYKTSDGGSTVNARGVFDLGTALPHWRGNFVAMWDHPSGVTAGLNTRYVGSLRECEQNDCTDDMPSRHVDSWTQVDLFAGYRVKSCMGTTSITVGVNNVANASPAVIYSGPQGDSDGTTYDLIGWQFYLRLQQSF